MWRAALAGTALIVGAIWLVGPGAERPAPALPAAPAPSAVRLFYPADRPPMLALPNGERRAVRSLLNVRRPLRYGEWRWDEGGVPAGPSWVRVDLARQTLSVFRAGHEIGSAVILYGTDGAPTPLGVFPVLEKDRDHRSSLYEAAMPYMLRLTGDGVAIHASDVRYGRATHGCIGVPPDFARRLFEQVRRGEPVAIVAA